MGLEGENEPLSNRIPPPSKKPQRRHRQEHYVQPPQPRVLEKRLRAAPPVLAISCSADHDSVRVQLREFFCELDRGRVCCGDVAAG